MLKVTWRQAAAWRVRRHYLEKRAPAGSLLAVAGRLCGLHAQLMSSAELTVWARVEGLDRAAVGRALWTERTLVKTWAMRGTLHLLPAAELPLWYAALANSRRYLRPAQWQKYFGITMAELDQLSQAVGAALEDRVMTREELMNEVHRLTGAAAFSKKIVESSWGTILKPAAFAGNLCFAPNRGQRVCFTQPASWLAALRHAGNERVNADAVPAEVTRRFLAAYGPATIHDLARWWNGGGISIARQWIAALGDEAVPVDLDGAPAWMLAKHMRELREARALRSVRLLPAFDQYVIGASFHATKLLPGDLRSRVFRPQGWVSPVLLVNGRMLGVWRHQMKGSRVEVAIESFVSLPKWARRAAEDEGGRLAAFLGGDLSLSLSGRA